MDYLHLLNSAIRLAAPVILIAMGGLFALKVDVFNLALDGFTLIGCFASVIGVYYTNSVLLGILIGLTITIIMTLIYAIFVIELHVNPVVCSVAFITLSTGLTRYLMIPIFNASGKYVLPGKIALNPIHFKLLDSIPVIGPLLNNHYILVYFALIAPFLIYIFLYKTSGGLSMRAVGQSQEAAEAAGINVKRMKYIALAFNGLFAGLAGAQLALTLNMFNVGMTAGRGFTALAVLILTNSEPLLALLAGLLFGLADSIANYLSADGYPPQILGMLPYILALTAAILPLALKLLFRSQKKKKNERKVMILKQ